MKKKGKRAGTVVANVDISLDDDGSSLEDNTASFFTDDIEDFHIHKDKILLAKGVSRDDNEISSDNQEEVLGIESDNEEDRSDDMASDLESDKDEILDDKAWGTKRKKFYGADVDDSDEIDFSGSETDAAVMEEQAALELQKKLAEEMDEQDFGLEIFKPKTRVETEPEEEEKIPTDLTQLSHKEKLKLLKKESPELLGLIEDFKLKLTEAKDKLLPLMTFVRNGALAESSATDYVNTKLQLILNYCVNINFYMVLRAKHVPVANHPVIDRLVQYRNLLHQLEPIADKLALEIDQILSSGPTAPQKILQKRKTKVKTKTESQPVVKRKSKLLTELVSDSDEEELPPKKEGGRSRNKKQKTKHETRDEKAALEYYAMMKQGKSNISEGGDEEDGIAETPHDDAALSDNEDVGDAKRGITYQIAKNKGLTPHRKKELRNPRVKHRMKYRKAKIRRKGMIREARTETTRYGGEISGIRAGIVRGVKLK